jgi:hypothetical protein
MRRVWVLLMVSAVSLILASCNDVLMERPLSDEKTSIFDVRLLGEWIPATESSRDEQETFFFGRNEQDKNTLDLIWVAKRDERIASAPFQAYVTVANKRYISFVYRGKDDTSRTAKLAIAYKYEMPDNETLWLWSIDWNFMRAAIERHEMHGIVGTGITATSLSVDENGKSVRAPVVALRPWEQPGGSNIELSDPPSKILAFLERNDAACFHDRLLKTYTRVPRLSVFKRDH